MRTIEAVVLGGTKQAGTLGIIYLGDLILDVFYRDYFVCRVGNPSK